MKNNLVGILLSMMSLAVFGETYYVAPAPDGNESYDGLAAKWDGVHGPKLKIQSAVDLAQANDTVSVAAGTYGDEQGYTALVSGRPNCRVLIERNITLVAPEGRDKTVLLGKVGGGSSCQDNTAIAGIVIGESAGGVKISGFTFRDCSANESSGNIPGASVLFLATNKGFSGQPWVSDCAVSNSYCYRGTFGYVNVARTIITGCHTRENVSVGYMSNFVHCLFTGNSDDSGSGLSAQPLIWGGAYVVNCTFARNGSAMTQSGANAPTRMCNCLVAEERNPAMRASYIYNCVTEGVAASVTAATDSGDNFVSQKYQMGAPALGDFRPVSDLSALRASTVAVAHAATAGSTSWLAGFPEEYKWKDVYGEQVVPQGTTIAAGAVQTTMVPVQGFTADENVVVDGAEPRLPRLNSKLVMNILTEDYPRYFKLSSLIPASTGVFHYLMKNDSGSNDSKLGYRRVPDADGTALFMSAKGGQVLDTIKVEPATVNIWVKKSGSDTTGNGSEGNPYATIQKAVDSITDSSSVYAIVHVGPGVYAEGGKANGDETIVNRVLISHANAGIALRSTDGAAATVIKGQVDSGTQGLGATAVRCVKTANNWRTQISGFTFADGSAADDQSQANGFGGALHGGSSLTALSDCVVTNCFGCGAVVFNAQMRRCVIENCTGVTDGGNGNIFRNGYAVSCVFWNNTSPNPAISISDTFPLNCTFYETGHMIVYSQHSYFMNCIVGKANGTSNNSLQKQIAGGLFGEFNYAYASGPNRPNVNFVNADPKFVNAGAGDFRLCSDSPAFGNAVNAWSDELTTLTDDERYTYYYMHLGRDIEGNEPYFVNGKPTLGAYYKPAKQAVSASGPSRVSIESSATDGYADMDETVTVTVSSGDCPVLGMEINGVFHEGLTTYSFTPADEPFRGAWTFRAVMPDPMVWYVSPNGNDGNNAWTDATPCRKLTTAMEHAVSGDVVMALPGTYAEGSALNGQVLVEPHVPSRVVVKAGVTLRSRDGAEKTVIKGEKDSAGTYGLGTGAVRCAFLEADAVLEGFTLTGGATRDATADDYDDSHGGGVLAQQRSADRKGVDTTSYVRDCIISNNASCVGGGGSNGNYERCRFFGNTAKIRGGGVNEAWFLRECIVDRNFSSSGASENYYATGCTFGKDNFALDGLTQAPVQYQANPTYATWWVKNCLFLGGVSNVRFAYNCAAPDASALRTSQATSARENMQYGDVSVDADYRPILGNVAVDTANPEYRPSSLPDRDASLNPLDAQRVYNGALDIGALEGDWRKKYGRDIASCLAVTRVSPMVTETTSQTVALGAGDALVAQWKGLGQGKDVGYTLNFRVAEGAVASVTVNNVTNVFAAGVHAYNFTSALAQNDISIVAQDGEVELLKSRRNIGLVLVVR